MLIGILAGLATCALWGLTFIAPRVVDPFSTWDLTVARYGYSVWCPCCSCCIRAFAPAVLASVFG